MVVRITSFFDLWCSVQQYMPLPQEDDLAPSDSSSADVATPKLQFSYVECLMYAFHQIARQCPQFLTAEENADRLKDFRMRLLCFVFICLHQLINSNNNIF